MIETVEVNSVELRKVGIWNRAALALVSVLVGYVVGSFLNDVLGGGIFPGGAPEILVDFRDYLAFTAMYGLAGWVAWYLVFIWFTDVRARRISVMLALGTIMGPLSIFAVFACSGGVHLLMGTPRLALAFYAFGAIDAFVTTLIDLLLLRWQQDRRQNHPIRWTAGRTT